MTKRYRIIVNPTADGGAAQDSVATIRTLLEGHNLVFDIVHTERPLHAVSLAREAVAERCDVVVAAGGDGTANEVLNGLMQAKRANEGTAALGVLCVGRGNDFAFGTAIPRDLEAGCAALSEDRRRTIDIGRVEGPTLPKERFFGNGVGIGFDAVVGFEAAKLKRLRGFLGYLVAALKTIFLYFHAPLVHIEHDTGTLEVASLMVSVMNGRRLGGGFMMAPQALVDDGFLNLCIARQVSRPRIFALIARFMKGTQADHPAITTLRTQWVSVTARQGVLPAHADGETLCTEGTQLTIRLLPSQIEIVCARERTS